MVNFNDYDEPRPMKAPSRQARGRLGGLTTSMTHDMKEMAARARAGHQTRFEREVQESTKPGEVLSEEEFARRVDVARKLFYQRLALSGAAARRERGKKK